MKLDEYREITKEVLIQPLEKLGFEAIDDHIYLIERESCFSLLRIKDKWTNISQQFKYLAEVRHNFLPDLEGQKLDGFVNHAANYPFKCNPLKLEKLKSGLLSKKLNYKYESCNLGHYDTLNIDYGSDNPLPILNSIRDQLSTVGLEWFRYLEPREAAKQIQENGNAEYIEKIWSEAYFKHGY